MIFLISLIAFKKMRRIKESVKTIARMSATNFVISIVDIKAKPDNFI